MLLNNLWWHENEGMVVFSEKDQRMTSDNKYLSLCVLILTFLTHHVEHEKPFKGKTASEFEKAYKLVLKTYLFTLVKD